jgi:hypothetical protein
LKKEEAAVKLMKKNIGQPDETRTFGHGHMDVVKAGDLVFGKGVFLPGWKWSNDVKPIARTESCQVSHNGFIVSGRMAIRMDDGTQVEIGPGDVFVCAPGHDAWVVGDEPCIAYDFSGAAVYARPA